nr:MAG TPA: hypothetical protein [Caudoviricetes sp.]DAN74180.1 MAG TPA: hypothetical protein [Caudoviricetes sp.]
MSTFSLLIVSVCKPDWGNAFFIALYILTKLLTDNADRC